MRSHPALALLALTAPLTALSRDDWPQWRGPQRDGVWRETDVLERLPADGPEVLVVRRNPDNSIFDAHCAW